MSAQSVLTPFNLGAILVSLALVTAPHAAHLPLWIAAFAGAMLLARFYFGYRRKGLPNRWLLFGVALVSVTGIAFSYRTLYGRDVGVALLTVMVCLKLMEMSAARDTMVVLLLAYFLVITNFFYSQTIPTALYMLLVVWVITATMIALQHRASRASPARALRHSGALILQAVPVMVVLFVLFPRVQGPLWGLPQINAASRTGLSDTMSPGDVSVLGLSDEVAFRVLFENPPAKPSQLYWRGPVLSMFDGQTWHAGLSLTVNSLEFEALGPPLRYTVTMEPHDRRWMFAIDVPRAAPAEGFLTSDMQMRSRRLVRERMRYEIESVPEYRIGVNERTFDLNGAMRLPASVAPRARALAERWKQESANPREIVDRGLGMFRQQPFIYTLAPPTLGDDPVDEFLFTTRSGFCEHYASSFAFLMRAAGIPARVVTGYLGGEVNPVDGYLVVRQSEAHAWTEVWLAGEGWVRVDPTAAVSPLRVERGLSAAVPASERNALAAGRLDWLKQMRFGVGRSGEFLEPVGAGLQPGTSGPFPVADGAAGGDLAEHGDRTDGGKRRDRAGASRPLAHAPGQAPARTRAKTVREVLREDGPPRRPPPRQRRSGAISLRASRCSFPTCGKARNGSARYTLPCGMAGRLETRHCMREFRDVVRSFG